MNLHPTTGRRAAVLPLLVGGLLLAPLPARAQDPCPSATAPLAVAGWEAYQGGRMEEARARFKEAMGRCDNDQYARTGLGYVELREGDEERARSLFQTVTRAEPDNVDALVGLGLVAWRDGDVDAVRGRFDRVLELSPDHPTAVEYLERTEGRASTGPAPGGDAADRAWREGDTDRAFELYRARLEADPDDDRALHRLALMNAWIEEYDRSLELFDRLLSAAPLNLDARVDRARVLAWRGENDEALSELNAVLAQHPDHTGALEARALFQAWQGRYDESLSTYERLLSISPEHADAQRQRAQVLAWASDFEGSEAAYRALLEEDPDDVEARLGLARSHAFAGELDRALAQYDSILAGSPENVAAMQGKARTLAWDDRLVDAEALAREAVAVDPEASASWIVLGQVLQWQGRNAAAREALEEAIALSPTDGDAHDQLRVVDLALSPMARPSTTYEADSDDNRMVTTAVTAGWHPVPRLDLRLDAYRRGVEQNALERVSFGGMLTGTWVAEPGWRLLVGVGGSVTDAPGTPSYASVRAGVRSPERHVVRGAVDVSSQALDETAALTQRGVRFTSFAGSVRWKPRPVWRVDAAAGYALFDGSEENRRVSGSLSASRRMGRSFSLGAGLRTFGYDKDLDDGYFDPDYYGIFEVTSWWRHAPRPWSMLVEAAPGVQQVTSEGDPTFTLRGSLRVGYRIAPGRELSLSYGYSTAGLLSFSTGSSDYRYSAVVLALDWVF